MNVQRQDHRRGLRKLIDQLITSPDLHCGSLKTLSPTSRLEKYPRPAAAAASAWLATVSECACAAHRMKASGQTGERRNCALVACRAPFEVESPDP
jgi:hypothetical protein